ncbi:MAG: FMN-binding protein [Defluviitaleaceae bacterium]|nr:FMN-binding protein [Defluviitaleaceae bacterium]
MKIMMLLFILMILAACGSGQAEPANERTSLTFRQGVYTGTAAGFLGDVRLEVEINDAGQVVRIDVLSHNETPGFAYPTFEIMRAEILQDQSTNVDLISGATATSRAFRDAVESALMQAGATLAQLRPDATPMPQRTDDAYEPPEHVVLVIDDALSEAALAALPIATGNFTPGVFTAVVPGWQEAPMTVQVTFDENRITGIEILDHNESMYGSGWAFRAMPAVPDQILVRQSTQDIDAFTGATATRDAIINAVENAIVQAGAEPSALSPQFIDAPLPGDRFIPGYIEITVPAGTMDIYGNPLTGDAMRMLYSEDDDMNLRISFGRNEFHLHTGGAFGLGQGAGGHGESIYEPGTIGGGALGGWWFRQVVNHQVNDRQSTQNIDIYTGATMSAAAIIWGVEQAMIAQGANPADITPITHSQIRRAPDADPSSPFFVPGIYTVVVDGWGGPMTVRVTLDRTNIRRLEVLEHNETDLFWDMVWGAPADHVIRDAIFAAGAANLDDVDVVTGATISSEAIINAVRSATEQAWSY